jgi:hypothetical protein
MPCICEFPVLADVWGLLNHQTGGSHEGRRGDHPAARARHSIKAIAAALLLGSGAEKVLFQGNAIEDVLRGV